MVIQKTSREHQQHEGKPKVRLVTRRSMVRSQIEAGLLAGERRDRPIGDDVPLRCRSPPSSF